MTRAEKMNARIEALRADEVAAKAAHAEALVAAGDDDTGLDIDRRAIKRLADQLASIRAEIEGLEAAMSRAGELDEADRAREAAQQRLAEFRAFEASLAPRLEAAKAFERALGALVGAIEQVKAADALAAPDMRRESPWRHALVRALQPLLGRGEALPRPGDRPQPVAFWQDDLFGFVRREHEHRAYQMGHALHHEGVLNELPTMPETVQAAPAAPEATASQPETFDGSFIKMPDDFFTRPDDARVFKKTDAGMVVAEDHPGYPGMRRAPTVRTIG